MCLEIYLIVIIKRRGKYSTTVKKNIKIRGKSKRLKEKSSPRNAFIQNFGIGVTVIKEI